MSKKCRKRPLSKNEDIKALRHFEENNYQDLYANWNKIDLTVSTLLKSPPPVHSLNFTSYPIPMFSILGLKFKLKSKLLNSFNVMQKIRVKSCCLLL